MQLHKYPRPLNDTGIGIHWCPRANQVPVAELRSVWLPELEALGVKWIKIPTLHGAGPLAEELLAAGIMPIVQLPLNTSLPSGVAKRELEAVSRLIDIGVRYIELPDRPDHPERWQGNRLPPDVVSQYTELLAADLEAILERGGMPGLPALAPTSRWDLFSGLVERHAGLLDGPVWLAVHNYCLNRPIDFPHDAASREGAPVTPDYYDVVSQETQTTDPWHGLGRLEVNRLRAEARDSHSGNLTPDHRLRWRSFEVQVALMKEVLGHTLPVLSTWSGWRIGCSDDRRYPAVTPQMHMAYTLEACRVMMGTSRRHAAAPEDYFCTSFWLLADRALHGSVGAELEAWYRADPAKPVLPIVPALKDEPKRARVRRVDRHPVEVERRSSLSITTGSSVITESDAGARRRQSLAESIVQGTVRGGAGAAVRLVSTDGDFYTTVARSNGYFRFINLPAGQYTIWVADPVGSRRENLHLDGTDHQDKTLAVDGWGHEVAVSESGDRRTLLRCRVEASVMTSDSGTLAVRLRQLGQGGDSGRVISMARRADGATGCEVGPLASGLYKIEVLGVTNHSGEPHPLETEVEVQSGMTTQLKFVFSPAAGVRWYTFSRLEGTVYSADGGNVDGGRVRIVDERGRERDAAIDEKGEYAFEDLSIGVYQIFVPGHEQSTFQRIALDGHSDLRLDFTLVSERVGAVEGDLSNLYTGSLKVIGSGLKERTLTLVDSAGKRAGRIASVHDRGVDAWHFEQLVPGIYTLYGTGYVVPGLDVRYRRCLVVHLPPPDEKWNWEIRQEETRRGRSSLHVRILGRETETVWVRGGNLDDRLLARSRNGGPATAGLEPIQPGSYQVQLPSVGTGSQVDIAQDQITTLTARRGGGFLAPLRLAYQAWS